jgi:hypothetical protein
MPDLCYRCFAQGHECAAHDIDPENNRPICAFCADGEPCPIAKRQQRVAVAPPAAAVDPYKLPEITDQDIEDDAVSALRNQGFTARQARNAVLAAITETGAHDLSEIIRIALAKGRKAPIPAPTQTQEKNEMATHKCGSRDCDKQIAINKKFCDNKCYGREWYHRNKEKDGNGSSASPKATPPRKSAAKAVAPAPAKSNGHAITVDTDADLANICVTSDQLNDWFSARSIADRAAIFQHWLNGHIGVTA